MSQFVSEICEKPVEVCPLERHVRSRTLHRIWGFRLAKQRVRCLRSNESYPVKLGHWETAMGIKSYTAASTAALALGLFFTPPVSIAIDAMIKHGRVARLTRHRQSQLHVPRNGASGRTHEKTIGCTQCVQQSGKRF